jgi:hypothetical protein
MKSSMKIRFLLVLFFLFALPMSAFAASASVGALYPAAEVPAGARVTFSMITSGFTNPTFYLTDSFPGGATSVNIDANGNFSWTPNKDDAGSHTLTVTVSDAQGDTASASQTITVDGAASLAISAPNPSAAVSIGVPVSFSVSASGLLYPAYTVSDSFSGSSMQSYALNASGAFSWTPIAQDIGTHTVVVTAKDSYGNTASASTAITVLPSALVSVVKVAPGTTLNAGQTLTFVATTTGFINPAFAVTDSSGGTVSTSSVVIDATGNASWTPQSTDVGTHPLRIVVSDSGGRSASAALTVTVLPPLPAAPTAATSSTAAASPSPSTAAPQPAASAPQAQQATQHAAAPSAAAQTQPAPSATQDAFQQTQTQPAFTDSFVPNPVYVSSPSSATVTPSAAVPSAPSSFGAYIVESIVTFFTSILNLF